MAADSISTAIAPVAARAVRAPHRPPETMWSVLTIGPVCTRMTRRRSSATSGAAARSTARPLLVADLSRYDDVPGAQRRISGRPRLPRPPPRLGASGLKPRQPLLHLRWTHAAALNADAVQHGATQRMLAVQRAAPSRPRANRQFIDPGPRRMQSRTIAAPSALIGKTKRYIS